MRFQGHLLWYTFNVVMPYFLVAMGGNFLGVGSSALEEARKHMIHRYHNHTGISLAQTSAVQQRLASRWSSLGRTQQLIHHVARNFDAGEPDALITLMASEAEVADCVVMMVNAAMTTTGGIGYRKGSTLRRMLRDVRACHRMLPTMDMLRVWFWRALPGQPLLAD